MGEIVANFLVVFRRKAMSWRGKSTGWAGQLERKPMEGSDHHRWYWVCLFFFVACISIRMKLKFVHVCILLVKVGLNLDSRSSVGSLVLHWKGLCLYIRLISISL